MWRTFKKRMFISSQLPRRLSLFGRRAMRGEMVQTRKKRRELLFVWSAPLERPSVGQRSTVADVTHTYGYTYTYKHFYVTYMYMTSTGPSHWKEKFTKNLYRKSFFDVFRLRGRTHFTPSHKSLSDPFFYPLPPFFTL